MKDKLLLRTGCIVLSIWSGLNLLASLFVVIIPVVIGGETAPALLDSLSDHEIQSLNDGIKRNANGIAVFANGINIACCTLIFFAIWKGLYQRVRWVFGALLVSLSLMVIAGTVADYVAGLPHPEVNMISGTIIAVGLACSAPAIFKKESLPL